MNTAQRVRRAGLATVAALVIGGGGFAVGAAAAEPSASGTPVAATATQNPAGESGNRSSTKSARAVPARVYPRSGVPTRV